MGEVRTAIRVVDKSSSALNKINARLQAMQKQMESIAKSSQATNDALQKVASTNDKLASVLNKTTSASTRAAAGHNRNKAALDGYNNSTKRGITYTDQLIGKLRRLASTYLGVMGAQAAITAGDAITRTENQLGTIYDQQQTAAGLPLSSGADDQRLIAFQEQSLQKIFNSAQKVRTGFTDMAQNVSKSMVLAGDAFENNIDNAIRFQEIMGEAYAVGGASAAEQASSMYQMVQALGSGILQGDELRSVREGAAMAYNEIEKFAQGVYNTTDSLKDMASEGMITSDLVVAAILNAGDTMDAAFGKTTMTFGQMWTVFKNDAVWAFKPVLQQLNDLANSDAAHILYGKFRDALYGIADFFQYMLTVAQSVLNFIADHFWIVQVASIALGAAIITKIVFALYAAYGAARTFFTEMTKLQKAQLIGFGIVTVFLLTAYAVYQVYQVTGNLATSLGYVLILLSGIIISAYLVAFAFGFMASPIYLVIALIALLAGIFLLFTEQVIGGVYAIGAIVENVLMFIWNLFVAVVYWITAGVTNIITVFQNACDNIMTFFSNTWATVKAGFWQFISEVVAGLSQLFGWLNKIPGVNIDFEGTSSKFAGYASAATGRKGSYKSLTSGWIDMTDAFSEGMNTLQLNNVYDAYSKGASVGAGIQDAINGFFSNVGDKFNFDYKAPGAPDTPWLNPSINPSGFTPSALDDIAGDAAKTAKNTDEIADSMELTEQDLAYLRKVAEMEWKKEFTTASVVINMENNNVINNESDLDGLVQKIADVMETELSIVADGVYT